MPAPRLILASASPRRHDLMREAGYAFEVIPSSAQEIDGQGLPPGELTEHNARLKATDVGNANPSALVIGADTLVFIDDQPLGKPADLAAARAMLARLSGRTHQVCTGVCLHHPQRAESACFHEVTEVSFHPLGGPEIDQYLAVIDPLDKAGSYAAQEHGSMIIKQTRGSWTNVVGLPMERLAAELGRCGITPV